MAADARDPGPSIGPRRGITVRRAAVVLLLLGLVSTQGGCLYLASRAHDWQDSFRVTVSAGLGAKIHLQVGSLGFGAGYWEGYEAGYMQETGLGVHRTSYFGIPIPFNFGLILLFPWSQPMFVFTHRDHIEGYGSNIGLFHITSRFYEDNDKPPKLNIWWYEIDVRVFVGLRLAVNIAEFLDFLLGFFGIDIMSDDGWGRE